MAISLQVSGTVLVKVGPTGGTLTDLGYTINGVQFREEALYEDIHSDEQGGDAGPPIDKLFLGKRIELDMELIRFDASVADVIAKRLSKATGVTPGQRLPPGTPLVASENSYRVVLAYGTGGLEFPAAVCTRMSTVKGSRANRLQLTFECYPDADGNIYKPYTP